MLIYYNTHPLAVEAVITKDKCVTNDNREYGIGQLCSELNISGSLSLGLSEVTLILRGFWGCEVTELLRELTEFRRVVAGNSVTELRRGLGVKELTELRRELAPFLWVSESRPGLTPFPGVSELRRGLRRDALLFGDTDGPPRREARLPRGVRRWGSSVTISKVSGSRFSRSGLKTMENLPPTPPRSTGMPFSSKAVPSAFIWRCLNRNFSLDTASIRFSRLSASINSLKNKHRLLKH